MPPLRQRKEDIPLLASHFMRRFSGEANRPTGRISRKALDELMFHDWPGNVRELENAIERAVVIGKEPTLQPADLPFFRPLSEIGLQEMSLEAVQRAHIAKVLEAGDWNIARCARILGVDRSTLYAKIKRYGLSRPKA